MPLYSDMHRFIPAMTLPMGARIAEVGVHHHARQFGTSKYGLSRVFKVFLDLIAIKMLLLFARHPLTRFGGLAALSALAALAFGWQIFAGGGSGDSVMIYTAVATLFASLAVFLLLLGTFATLVFRRAAQATPSWMNEN